jgi:ABC-type dipeptide/oligopeptide/nickel transport system ATPase subunit
MNKLKVELENCYGIKKLNYDFDFTVKPTYAIYAPNGIMKTSLAKTFLDLSNDQASHDSIFKERKNVRNISDETNTEINKEKVFVILPYAQEYKSKKISTLLVNKELKEKYENIHTDINEKKEILIKELKTLTGIKKGIEETLSNDFTYTPKEFFKSILRLKTEVLDKTEPAFENIIYQKIFNDKVVAFLETKDFKTKLAEYISKYNELIDSSTYFKKGIFNHNNASTIAKNLKDNGFFKANHSVSLNAKEKNRMITTESELEEVIKQEKDSILKNPDLVKAFEAIDTAITKNQELRSFRDYIETNSSILPELLNLNALKQKLWISYLKRNIEAYKTLESEYSNGQKEIEKIVAEAKKQKTQWINVIDEFNKRFFVPFKLSVDNQEDVILKSELPSIKFDFKDFADSTPIEEVELFKVLSSGELRALYILNIIFEVEARKESKQETLFVVDDIADSFDYKNKYAIIEYLKDISNEGIFKQIILTHNFDFYRTVCGRLDMKRKNKLNTIRTKDGIKLVEEKYQNNPFDHWKNEFHKVDKESMLIASIPFVRNIAEYSGYANNLLKLTSLLHIKEDTKTITIANLQVIFIDILKDKSTLVLSNEGKIVLDLIYEIADTILIDTSEIIDLENKIVLAIAIRLKAEEFMITKINNDVFWKGITTHQTFALIEKYKNDFSAEAANIALLEQVNLMTPENIHLNSFMYEPILDMSNDHLKLLYQDIKKLK